MSGLTITVEQRASISTYLSEVLLHDMLKAKIAELEGGSSAILASVVGAVIGGVVTLGSGGAVASLGGAVLGAILPSLITENLNRFQPLPNASAARIQANNFYWYLVKRQIFCNLPANTADINDTFVARVAQEIENIVPYDGNDFGSKTSANQFLSSFLRSIPVNELRNIIEIAAQRWTGNRNGLALPEVGSGCLTPNMALIPIIGDSGVIPISQKVGPNTWLISASQPGQYKWRTAFKDQTYRVDGYTLVQPPTLNSVFPFAILWNDGVQENVSPLTNLPTKCFDEMLWQSDTPFSLYITISECAGSAIAHPTAFTQFAPDSPASVLENSSVVTRVVLRANAPLAEPVSVNVGVDPASTALLGSDFTLNQSQVTFNTGDVSGAYRDVIVSALADNVSEAYERMILRLANATGGAQIGLPNTHVLTIRDPREVLYIPATGAQIPTRFPTVPGARYRLVAKGTYNLGTGSGYSYTGDPLYYWDNSNPTNKIYGEYGMKFNGYRLSDRAYASNNTYEYEVIGNGDIWHFWIADSTYFDNGGGLTIELTQLP